jgi:hypothetical protein
VAAKINNASPTALRVTVLLAFNSIPPSRDIVTFWGTSPHCRNED